MAQYPICLGERLVHLAFISVIFKKIIYYIVNHFKLCTVAIILKSFLFHSLEYIFYHTIYHIIGNTFAGVKYTQNEVYVDIIEEIDGIIDAYGNIVTSEVSTLSLYLSVSPFSLPLLLSISIAHTLFSLLLLF